MLLDAKCVHPSTHRDNIGKHQSAHVTKNINQFLFFAFYFESKSNPIEKPRDLQSVGDIPYKTLESMYNSMYYLGKESRKSQDPKTKAEAQVSNEPETAASLFFGIEELRYKSLNEMAINQLGQMADSAEVAENCGFSINVRVLFTEKYEQYKNGNNISIKHFQFYSLNFSILYN